MAKFLFVVDLQPEFAKGMKGNKIYKRAVNYIYSHRDDYACIYAAVYHQDPIAFTNMQRKIGWNECTTVAPIEFPYDRIFYHSGYSISEYPNFTKDDVVDIIGFDTDACVLSACFHLFDLDCDLNILSDYIYSSGGETMHKCGLAIMERQFRKSLK